MPIEIEFDSKEVRDLMGHLANRFQKISKKSKEYTDALSKVVIEDIDEHFSRQSGPSGRWQRWSVAYRKIMDKRGKGGNFILTDTGRLRAGWTNRRIEITNDGIVWLNPIPYASIHDEGSSRMPQRSFAWLSDKAVENLAGETIKFLRLK